ncbi:DUF305 domain-containing protein [Jidongwangia harbinensis]|uniref:DUF305 domain-containing protein n=1 Tax=Jidongwangia harbinensis TaxID=2878561 RepID=UPI001CD9964B|nr:DUF305 domain-containing protein [Jidongwangia harbinensis]MCA2215902.1 DUF305 domain-containing protein [Jidongwangia harbinensis]
MTPRRSLLGIALGLALTSAGCGRPTPLPRATPITVAPSFGGTDRAWLEITIAMDEEVLPLLDLAATRGGTPRLRTLATDVMAFHQQELATLRELHGLAGLPAENPHKGMPMPGMVTAGQVAEAAAASGARFDRLLVTRLGAHLDQGVRLAGSAEASGAEPRTRKLAARARTERERFRAALRTVPA